MKFSTDIHEKLTCYVALLEKWQPSINLVSKKTLDNAWERHIVDSAQLSSHIPKNKALLDLGSGAGFPGLVIAIMRPDLSVTLIESDERKCTFLKAVSRETSTSVTIKNKRIEDIEIIESHDFVSARALAPLQKLLDYTSQLRAHYPQQEYLFLKGQAAAIEIETAKREYDFDIKTFKSLTNDESQILHLKNVYLLLADSVSRET